MSNAVTLVARGRQAPISVGMRPSSLLERSNDLIVTEREVGAASRTVRLMRPAHLLIVMVHSRCSLPVLRALRFGNDAKFWSSQLHSAFETRAKLRRYPFSFFAEFDRL